MQGATLIEVLVSMVILALGMLGLASLQVANLRNNQAAYYRSQATFLGYDILDRMRVNRSVAAQYVVAVDANAAGGGNAVAVADVPAWKAALNADLPEGEGAVTLNGNLATICVVWDDRRPAGQAADPCFAASLNPAAPACAAGAVASRRACFRTQAGI